MTNCGHLGWISDKSGYSYSAVDPESGKTWPAMPAPFLRLATNAASEAGFSGFVPNACLINRYEAGTKLSLHQDKDEKDFSQPIVSVSLGIPAVFLFGGLKRTDKTQRFVVQHGDVIVWGGPSRLRYHGILPVKEGKHPLLGSYRVNLTFRKAG
jgi:alkylated DNA repair protein (DNA oxidative demethylase)